VNPTSADFKFPNAKRQRGEGNNLIAPTGATKPRIPPITVNMIEMRVPEGISRWGFLL
jgi:hypothetical protein